MQSIVNKEARSKYEFLQEWDAGLVLTGAEVKSIKSGGLNLRGAFIGIENGELWLKSAYIRPWQLSNQPGYEPEQPRKLLLRKQEIEQIIGKLNEKGLTIVPARVYSKGGILKMNVALARGLKKHDKREKLKKRTVDRKMSRHVRERY